MYKNNFVIIGNAKPLKGLFILFKKNQSEEDMLGRIWD